MYLHYRNLKLIQISGRPDEHNDAILRGDFLDKSPTYEYPEDYDPSIDDEFGRPVEEPFVMPTKDEMLKQFIFPDWQQGDILVIADQPLKYPKKQGDTLVEMTREEVCESGDLSVLVEGEVYQSGTIKTISIPDNLFSPKWEYPNWVESMPQEEQEDYHNKLIDTLKAELLEDGFIYPDKTKVSHQQKCRDKDLSYLGNAIASMEDASIPTMKWYFNNRDMLELTLEEMKSLRANGGIFLSTVFGIEAKMKAGKPTNNLTLTMFKDKVDAISQIKCWR